MNTMMLVDDEYMILRGIPKLIDWSELNVEIVKAEKSPLAALKYLKEHHIDILLSDMNMAELPGTQFLPKVKELQPDIQIIVLSGYEDFSYAKASLEQGVIDYLNKPIDPDELEDAIEKAQSKLKRTQHDIKVAKRLALDDVLSGRVKLSEIDESQSYLYLVGIWQVDEKIRTIIAESQNVLGYQDDGKFMYILLKGNRAELTNLSKSILPLIKNEVYTQLSTDEDLNEKFQNLKKRLNEVNFYQIQKKKLTLNKNCKVTLQVSELVSKINFSNFSAVTFDKYLRETFDELGRNGYSVADGKYFARLILMKLYGKKQKIDLDFSEILARVENSTTVDELIKIIMDFFRKYHIQVKNYPDLVNETLLYLDQNYMEDLTLKKVADVLHVNSVYLGSIFKKNLNQSFAKYLNNYRIAKAIALITTTNQDINEISNKVGYNNSNYFFRVFKDQTSMSPTEYRRMVKKQNNIL
ncbi:response regulator transcription factor [Lactobacillus kalixensis]|uniref:Response regulator n=1 Tax=Lactobacillus kalixensis DSM 16043 TaxID=1423763 RepID=A0A0R1U2I1_9LACO|nr:response regulator [Lactobacillus kalixensis]KRL87548.1 response regulator [Lactobacillus kalixensis DSM 16043]